jgi:GNAT superfamily N-acetyltransferase
MQLEVYSHRDHFRDVEQLWERVLGTTYPVSTRVLAFRLGDRPNYEPGDGVLALEQGRVVGMGITEVERSAATVAKAGNIMAVLVDPAHQGRGIGRTILDRMEERLRVAGCTEAHLSGGLYRFWSGVPLELPGVKEFFVRNGYTAFSGEVIDLVIPLADYAANPKYEQALRNAGIDVRSMAMPESGRTLDFQAREFSGWYPSMLAMLGAGDMANVLVLWHGAEVVGTIQTFTPGSRFRSANLVWERILGAGLGGFGAVGIDPRWRGKGLGSAMCQAAALHVKACGGTACLIDWTNLTGFYGKVGAQVWRHFYRAGKTL